MPFDLGDGATFQITFYGADNVTPIDPTTVTLTIKTPAGVVTTYTYNTDVILQRLATGVYSAVLTLTEYGIWRYRWVGSGAVPAVDEGSISVRPSNVVN